MNPCPNCGKLGMPSWSLFPGSAETARRCYQCGHVEEKPKTANAAGAAQERTPEAMHG